MVFNVNFSKYSEHDKFCNNDAVCRITPNILTSTEKKSSNSHKYVLFISTVPSFHLSGTVIAGIVIGTVVGIAILCCVVGTIVDCFVHIYKYWCSCIHKAYHYPTEMVALRTPRHSPSDPSVVIVRALPPSYSTVVTNCDSPTDSATVPMLQEESTSQSQQNGDVTLPRDYPKKKDYKHVRKRDLMVKVSRAAIRDCIPDIDSDLDEESEEEDKGERGQGSRNIRHQDLIIRNKHTFLTMEYSDNDPVVQFSKKRSYGVDTRDLQYYESNISAMKDNSIGTSTRDLSRYTSDGTLHRQPPKTVMVSKDIQTDEIVTYIVPNQVCLPPCHHGPFSKKAKEVVMKEDASSLENMHLFAPIASSSTLPPSYSSIFQNSNLIQLSSDMPCCNGVVELPPKEKIPPD